MMTVVPLLLTPFVLPLVVLVFLVMVEVEGMVDGGNNLDMVVF